MSAAIIISITISAISFFSIAVTVISFFVKVPDGEKVEITPRGMAILLILLAVLCLSIATLNNSITISNKDSPPITGIEFSQNVLYMEEGSSETLTLNILPFGASASIVQWTSWNPDIVDVNGSGKDGTEHTATPVSAGTSYTINAVRAGTASIEATCEGYSTKCTVVVTTSQLKFSSPALTLQTLPGGAFEIYIEPFYTGDCNDLSWSSSNTSVATILDDGFNNVETGVGIKSTHSATVYAVDSGTAVITVSCDGQSASFILYVD